LPAASHGSTSGRPRPNCASPRAAIFARPWARARPPSSRKSRRLRPARACSRGFRPARIAAAYQRGGAAALRAHRRDLLPGEPRRSRSARAAVSLPVLRKDFTIAAAQIVEAAAHGADAILLIAAILTEREIRDFREAAARYRMAALVEVHNRRELDAAIAAGSDIIGVNNRDL
jgi:indole-3-glycerol phosphate synthase